MKDLIFVTGAGTGVGKTYAAVLLIKEALSAGRKVVALKPVLSGAPELDDPAFAETDTAQLLKAQGSPADKDHVAQTTPWLFKAPLSPDMAARAEGRSINFDVLVDWTRTRIRGVQPGALIVIEGAGGVMSPLTAMNTNLDLIAALGARALLVAGNYLGAISHALTAIEALRARNVGLAALAVSESEGDHPSLSATCETLQRFLPDERIAQLARGASSGLLHAVR